ncbi:MAG: hypothetical protein R3B06_32665 [Kofleriaceae bacterium]
MWRFAFLAVVAGCAPRALVSRGTSTPVVEAPSPGPTGTKSDTARSPAGAPAVEVAGPTAPQEPPTGVVLSRLPARHQERPAPAPAVETVAQARALVGRRDPRPPLDVALALAAQLTGRPTPAVGDARSLIAWAQAAMAWRAVPAVGPGDLIVFDRAVGGARASLVAVALGRDARGVVEVVYLGAGVIRRGFFDPSRPQLRRDRAGRIVNTSLRHNRDQPPRGTRFLAGELFAGVISTAPAR